tara:strand:+ start:10983 stop:13220 length:2238 start_codon:yes stop_codon:yes gene_type:complete
MGSDTLIIVESNGKCKKIEKLTGCKCIASFGHVFALKPSLKWFDPNSISPEYINHKGKEKIIANLKKEAKSYSRILIASDLDREGEAIAAHLMKLLKLNPETTERITFNQITASALKKALDNPGLLDKNLYYAQQARAVIDLVFGFTMSPFLSRHMNIRALSAGRCQTPAIRLCMERQQQQKVGETKVVAAAKSELFEKINHIQPTLFLDNIEDWLENLSGQQFNLTNITTREKKEMPPPPFITSSLQQSVYNSYNINPKYCMQIAQKLYEGGYITYMRTDSVALSSQFQDQATKWVDETFGKEYSCKRQYKKKGDVKAQEAHEAIRPIDIHKTAPSDKEYAKVYELIKNRAVASQMSPAKYDETKFKLETKGLKTESDIWESTSKKILFLGYTILKTKKDDTEKPTPQCQKGDKVDIQSVSVRETRETPPPPYNPASLVKLLEKTGIGRPSTYSSIVERIQEKGYVTIGTNPKLDLELREWCLTKDKGVVNSIYTQKIGGQNKVFLVTDLGQRVCEFFENSKVENIVSPDFTSSLEDKLDSVANGEMNWKEIVKVFHEELTSKIKEQPPPSKLQNKEREWIKILEQEANNAYTIGVIRTQYGFSIVKDTSGNLQYGNMPPNSKPESIELEEAKEMLSLPRKVDKYELKIGKFGWYATDGKRNISLGKDRAIPSNESVIEAFKNPTSEILKIISSDWSLRKKGDSCYLMYSKNKKAIFYPVKDPSGKWTTSRCEEIRKLKKKTSS